MRPLATACARSLLMACSSALPGAFSAQRLGTSGDGPPHVTITLHHPKIIGSAPASPYTNPATTARVLRTCHSTHQRRRSHLEPPQDRQHEYSHIMLALRVAQCAMQAWCDIMLTFCRIHTPQRLIHGLGLPLPDFERTNEQVHTYQNLGAWVK